MPAGAPSRSPRCSPRTREPRASGASASPRPPRVRGIQPGPEAARPPRLPARGARCAVPTPLRGPAALASHARERGFLKADPVASAHRRSPVPRAHDAHFQGRRCHDGTETQQPDACLSSLPLASARPCSLTCGGRSRGPRPSRFSANGRGHPPPGNPGLQRTARVDPPRHSREPLRTPGLGCPLRPVPPVPEACRDL